MSHTPQNQAYLYKIDWSTTRAIYKKLSEEFHMLTGAYSIVLDERTKLMLDHLILGIDDIDQTIDNLPTKAARDSITNSIINFLQNDQSSWLYSDANHALKLKVQTLKLIVKELNIEKRFLQAATNIFNFTEEKRHVDNKNTLISLVLKEGQATGELPLSVMNIPEDHDFGIFFTKLCTLMGVADLIVDARSDYRAKQISLKPNFALYLKLIKILLVEGLSLIWHFPRKWSFFKYCITFGLALILEKD